MKMQLVGVIILLGILVSGCSDETPKSEMSAEPQTEASAESQSEADTEADRQQEEKTEESSESVVSDDKKNILEKKFEGMANNPFIESITPKNTSYSEIVVVIDQNAQDLPDEAMRSKMTGIGKSIREATAGVVYDGEADRLPIVVFKNKEDKTIAEYDNRERNSDIIFY